MFARPYTITIKSGVAGSDRSWAPLKRRTTGEARTWNSQWENVDAILHLENNRLACAEVQDDSSRLPKDDSIPGLAHFGNPHKRPTCVGHLKDGLRRVSIAQHARQHLFSTICNPSTICICREVMLPRPAARRVYDLNVTDHTERTDGLRGA